MFSELHSSVLFNIAKMTCLNWKDVMMLKSASKHTNKEFDIKHVVEKLIKQESFEDIVDMCILSYKQSTILLDTLLEMGFHKKEPELERLLKCYILDIILDKPRVGKRGWTSAQKIDLIKNVVVGSLNAPKHCIHDKAPLVCIPSIQDISLKMIMQAACIVNDIEVFRYMYSLGVAFTNVDILAALMHGHTEIIKEMARLKNKKEGKRFHISERLMALFVLHWDVALVNIELYDFLFRCGFVRLRSKLAKAMVYTWTLHYVGRYDVHRKVMLIERYATNDNIVRSAFKQCIANCLPVSVNAFIDVSRRIVYSPKHLLMIEEASDFWEEHAPKVEFMLVNKLKMQERNLTGK